MSTLSQEIFAGDQTSAENEPIKFLGNFSLFDFVHYSPIIGKEHDGNFYQIQSLYVHNGENCAKISNKAGIVSLEALSKIPEGFIFLLNVANAFELRLPIQHETIEQYREYLAGQVQNFSPVEAHEIRLGKRRSAWTPEEKQNYEKGLFIKNMGVNR